MKFKPEDFIGLEFYPDGPSLKHCAVLANARLEEMLANAPVVYGKWNRTSGFYQASEWQDSSDTHDARLVDIKEIK